MATPILDPNPDNELGKGTLPPAIEAKFIERGAVFAQTVTRPDGTTYYRTARRPINECYTDAVRRIMEMQSRRY
jgi:hypothetical protein